MKIEEIQLKEFARNYTGYLPQMVCISTIYKPELSIYTQLKRIPPKISAFFDRSKIAKVYKSNHAPDPRDNYYLILSTDDTIFMIEY